MRTAQSSLSGAFSVAVDDKPPVKVDAYSKSKDASCGITWSSFGLENAFHNVSVLSFGLCITVIGEE